MKTYITIPQEEEACLDNQTDLKVKRRILRLRGVHQQSINLQSRPRRPAAIADGTVTLTDYVSAVRLVSDRP